MAQSLLEQLAQDPHILKIIPSTYTSFPQIDYTLFKQGEEEITNNSIVTIETYLKKTIIIDNFVTHEQRRAWRETISPQMRLLYEQNKLRHNVINNVGYITILTDICIQQVTAEMRILAFDIKENVQRAAQEYPLSQIFEKVNQINLLDKKIYHFLELLSTNPLSNIVENDSWPI